MSQFTGFISMRGSFVKTLHVCFLILLGLSVPVESLKIRPSRPVDYNPYAGGPKVFGNRMELLDGIVFVFGGQCSSAVYKGQNALS